VQFLERFNEEDQDRLLAACEAVHLKRGDYLLRRGERGGDVYLVDKGSLEVVDTRQRPEVVLDLLGPGTVVGEMAFMDASPRTADVRAVVDTTCQHWEQATLHRLLESEHDLAAAFYKALTGAVVDRVRSFTSTAVVGGLGKLVQDSGVVPAAVAEKAREIADLTRSVWVESDARLRINANDGEALNRARAAFGVLKEAVQTWISPMTDHGRAREAGDAVFKEVQPYLNRARAVVLAQGTGQEGMGEFMAHLLLDEPKGEGPFGILLDDALLGLPSVRGLRSRMQDAVSATLHDVPDGRPAQLALIHPNCGAVLAQLVARRAQTGALITCIDGDRATLAFVDLGLPKRPKSVELRFVHEDLALLSTGCSPLHFEPLDAIIVDGLVDYLPDRLVASLAGWCRGHLRIGGGLVLTGMGPAPDEMLIDHMLRWPMIRRSGGELLELAESVGLSGSIMPSSAEEPHPGLVIRAVRTD
jgi:hypothetical protein